VTPAQPAAEAPLPSAPPAPTRPQYETVADARPQLEHWIARINMAPLVALDNRDDLARPDGGETGRISLAVWPASTAMLACYIPLAHRYPGVPEQLLRAHPRTAEALAAERAA